MSLSKTNPNSYILPMKVDNVGFMLDRMGNDCHPLQFLRELTQNAIEAIKRASGAGTVVWDVDWNTLDLKKVFKVSIVDTGDGMTGEEMVKYINQLSSSGQQQSLSGNYGVGAKISAATRNHYGVIYLSWKGGQGSMIHLYRDPETCQYGLRQFPRADGSYTYFVPIEDDVKPQTIKDHGTMVILLGNEENEDTMRAPEGAASPSRWITKYLNTRYFEFPDGIVVKSREGWENSRSAEEKNYLRQITGQKDYLSKHCVNQGIVKITNAQVHWWILKEEDAMAYNSGLFESVGHAAGLYKNELYEMTTSRAGMSRLQDFGITFGYRWVVIYVEPIDSRDFKVLVNTSRTLLLANNQSLPWADWAAEFRDNMPQELVDFVDSKASTATTSDNTRSIRDRLRDLLGLYKVSRYKAVAGGHVAIDDIQVISGGHSIEIVPGTGVGTGTQTKGTRGSVRDGLGGNIYSLFEKKDGIPGAKLRTDPFPEVAWVRVEDGTREVGYIEDRAAKYISDQNLLQINGDFRVFGDMNQHFQREFGNSQGVTEVIGQAVKGWFEQALTETILGIQGMRNSKEWTVENIETAWSEESLTAAVMQRYHVVFAVKRELGSKLGAKKSA